MKTGWQTTEFWLSLAAAVVGALMVSGMFADGSTAMRIAGVASMVLASLGYSVSRATVKSAGAVSSQFAAGNILNTTPPVNDNTSAGDQKAAA